MWSLMRACRYLLLGMFLLSPAAFGQYQAPRRPGATVGVGGAAAEAAPVRGVINVKELVGTGRRALTPTPEFEVKNVRKSSTRPRDWAQITVRFDVAPEWIDNLVIEYHVLSMTRREGQNVYSLMRQTVEHLDVERGRDRLSAVFVPPAAVKRHGPPVAVYARFVVDGQMVAEVNEVDAAARQSGLPEDWWQNRLVLDNPNVTVRDGNLWKLFATPFAFINMDDYEVMR